MYADQLISWVRLNAYIGDASQYPDQTDAVLLQELTHKLHSVFEDIVVKARAGYWLKSQTLTTTAGRGRYRIPPRAVTGGLEGVELAATSGGQFYPLKEIPADEVAGWEPLSPATPKVFFVQGDVVQLYPAPSAVLPLRMAYYLRPSRLVLQQYQFPATERGRVTIVNTTARTITVNAIPQDQPLNESAATITSGVQRVDVVKPTGWHELALVDAPQTFAATTLTIGGTQDMSDIDVGDYVRCADQSEWPCLPDDFHRCLADVTAVKIAVELGLRETNDELARNVESDLVRFRSLLLPRVKSQPKEVPAMLRTRGGWR